MDKSTDMRHLNGSF